MARPSRAPFSRLPVLLLLVGATLVTTACEEDGLIVGNGGEADVTVMTRNLYLGANIFRLTEATSAAQIPAIAAEVFAQMQANDFEARAGALAAEIEAADPHLVGLQEVTLYRIQDPSDYVTGTTTANAEVVFLDYLAVLEDSLEARGLDYVVAAQVQNADVELPAADGEGGFFDVRLTDRDVILARSDVEITAEGAGDYTIIFSYPLASGETVDFDRGYTWVDAVVNDVAFTFVDTHFEVSAGGDLAIVQRAQANELIGVFETTSPLIAVGDFNTELGESPYTALMRHFTDAWTDFDSGDAGLTCCQPADLSETQPFYSRIDLILFTGPIEVLAAEVVGNETTDRTAGGLWPSDHAGVVATLRIRD